MPPVDTLATKGMTVLIPTGIICRESTHNCVFPGQQPWRHEDMESRGYWLAGDKLGP